MWCPEEVHNEWTHIHIEDVGDVEKVVKKLNIRK